ncbi:MAG TPA: hypothetical protein VFQ53_10795 [Kofleriaceae bacterium]|nr:hypothetical protein [Kofleriaceae bacterium]
MTNRILIMIVGIAMAACGGGDKDPPAQLDAPSADAFESDCGKPGDVGNELGIGKFCASLSDCSTTAAAPLCSSLGDPNTHFCTKTCSSTGPADQCGTGTECTCNASNQCGCTPSSCLN